MWLSLALPRETTTSSHVVLNTPPPTLPAVASPSLSNNFLHSCLKFEELTNFQSDNLSWGHSRGGKFPAKRPRILLGNPHSHTWSQTVRKQRRGQNGPSHDEGKKAPGMPCSSTGWSNKFWTFITKNIKMARKAEKKSWNFVYFVAKQPRSPFNLTIFLTILISLKKLWKFVYILAKQSRVPAIWQIFLTIPNSMVIKIFTKSKTCWVTP